MEKKTGRPTAIEAKARAAAQLVLQDLDPSAKKRRQLFSSGPPQGILALHVKTLTNFSKTFFFTSTFAGCSEIHLYLRIYIQDMVKCSRTVPVSRDSATQKSKLVLGNQAKLWSRKSLTVNDSRLGGNVQRGSLAKGEAEITFDEVKTFTLELSSDREDSTNQVHLELMEVDGTKSRTLMNIGFTSLHLYDLIKEMYGTKIVQLMKKGKRIADLEFEYIFRYGSFGFGYSHQLQQTDRSVSQIMKESLFFKLNPPAYRMDDHGLLTPTQVEPPDIIKKGGKLDEESTIVRNKAVASSTDMLETSDTSNVDQLIKHRNRLEKLKEEYVKLKTRNDRYKFLQSLFVKTGTPGNDSQGNTGEGNDHSDDALWSGGGLLSEMQRQLGTARTALGKFSPLLMMAPGLQLRRNSRPDRPSKSCDESGTEPDQLERLQNLYDKEVDSGSSEEADQEISKSRDQPSLQEARAKPATGGFMKILRNKVLTPIKMRKVIAGSSQIDPTISDAEEGQFSPRSTENEQKVTNVADLFQRFSATSDQPTTKKDSVAMNWKEESAPTTVVDETENSPRSTTSMKEKRDSQ